MQLSAFKNKTHSFIITQKLINTFYFKIKQFKNNTYKLKTKQTLKITHSI